MFGYDGIRESVLYMDNAWCLIIPTGQAGSQITSVCLASGTDARSSLAVQVLQPHVTSLILAEAQHR